MDYLTFIPYVNRKDLLIRAIQSIECMWPRTLVIDNSQAGELEGESLPVSVYRPCVPLLFAQTQNLMRRFAIEGNNSFYFFMHSDAMAEDDAAARFLEYVVGLKSKWGLLLNNRGGDALSCFNVEAVQAAGLWDWRGLTWYFADSDYYRRIKLAGYEMLYLDYPIHHVECQTRSSDTTINMAVSSQFDAAEQYYIMKWGGVPTKEIFNQPFNGEPDKPIPVATSGPKPIL